MSREIEFGRRPERHGLTAIQENTNRQFSFLFVELEKEFFEAAVQAPVEITEIIAMDVGAVVGEFNGLTTCAAAAFAFGGTLARREARS